MHSFRVTRAIFYFSVGVVCSSAHASKLEEYLEKARLRDPTYLNSKQLMSVAEEDLKISESALGPRISLGATAQRTERLEENRTLFGSTDVSRRFDSSNVNLQARQPIVRIRDRLSVEQAKFKRDSARYALIAAEQDLYIRFISAWVDILSANELLIAYKESRGVIEELVQESVRRLASGESTIQDLEQVKAKVAQSDALVEQSHFLVESARLSFELILGEKFLIPQSLRFSLFPMFSLQGMTQLSLLQSIES